MKIFLKLSTLAISMMLACASQATIFNFKSMAEPAGSHGESAWTTLSLAGAGFTVGITATDGADDDSTQYAYLDSGNAGLGVCADLVAGAPVNTKTHSGANLCNPSDDDNVTTMEALHFVFSTAVIINKIWFNNNHDVDQSLFGDTINIGGSPFTFTTDLGGPADYFTTSAYTVAANTDFTISYNNEQFYVSKMDVSIPPPVVDSPEPGSLALLGMGLLLLGALRRRNRV